LSEDTLKTIFSLRRRLASLALAASLFFFSSFLFAQVFSGSLTGVVTDESGAVLPNARVVLTDEDKGFTYTAASDAEGRYVLRNLPPGRYELAVTFTGMEPYDRKEIVLSVGLNGQADVHFRVKGATQTVDVGASAALLQTQDASTGQLVNQKFINDLPLTSRSVYNLAELSPGVSQPAGSSFGLNAGATNFVSNGGRNSTADIVMDGVSQTNSEQNGGVTTALYTPPVDAVQEFKVQQNTYSADVGFGGNTVINVVTKSGTNQFHGSAYEFLQNSDLNANNFFNNRNGVGIPPQKQNQFGGTLGGPIRKDKFFFFVDYQGTLSTNTGTATAGVPDSAERQGNFGELCGRAGGTFNGQGQCSAAAGQIWDPLSGTFNSTLNGAVRNQYVPFNNLATYQSPGNPNLVGTPYQLPNRPGNLIDPVALKMLQYFPMPNVGVGTAAYNPLNNWIGANGSSSSDHRFDTKFDYRLSDSSTLTGHFSRDLSNGQNVNCFGNVADPCTQGPNNGHAYSASVAYTRTFTPTLVFNLTYGWTRSDSHTEGVAADYPDFSPVTTLGLPQYITTSGFTATPNITFGNGYQAVSSQNLGSQTYSILQYPSDTHDLTASFDKIKGSHELKFGYEGRLHILSFLQVGNPEGQFNFAQTGTSQTPANGTGGDPLASLLIGYPQGGSGYGVDVAVTTQNYQHAWYFQDNWRVNSRLTVNLGLRYELTLPRTERYNRMSFLDPSAASPLQVPGLPNLMGGLQFASNSNPSPYKVDPMNFGPRVGVAYRTKGDIVIRTGYGIFFDNSKGGVSGTGEGGYTGFNWTTPLITTYNNDGATPAARLSNPFPNGVTLPPGSSQGLLTAVGLGVTAPLPTQNNTPYVQTWNFGLQRQIKGNILLDANYVGTKGTHLYFGGAGSIDYLGSFAEGLSPTQVGQLTSRVANPFYGIITNPSSSLSSKTVPAYQLLLPYPQFTGFSTQDPPWANSIYNALQLRVEKKFSNGLQLLTSYVWSKSIDDSSVTCGCTTWLGGSTSLQDPNKRFLERSVSQFDIPQVLQFSYTYAFPFGRGKRFGSNINRGVDLALGGWQTNGIWRFDDGMPLTLTVSNSQPLPTYGAQRPNLSGTLTKNAGSNLLNQYFADPQVATTPAQYAIGNAPREISSVRAPGTATTALSLFKQFKLDFMREGSLLEFRVEAFNALNHPQFGLTGASLTVGASSFGQVTEQANSPRQVQLALKLYF
jgi:hypothetical protein